MAKRNSIDWEQLEREYRIGQLSLRALAEKHGTTASTISRRAAKGAWVQDASQEVRERTRAALLVQPGPQEGEECNSVAPRRNTPTRMDVDVAVQTNLQVVGRHRRDIAHGQQLVSTLFHQLQEAAENRVELEDAIEDECQGDGNGQRRNRMLKAIALPTHAAVLRDLSTAIKNLIPLERQAYNLDEQSTGETLEDALARLERDGLL